jgi:hypothetical protein
MTTKESILAALHKFVAQRPGLEFANYGDGPSYRAELRSITRDCTEARRLLRYVERSSITTEQIIDAAKHSYSGRLSITPTDTGFVLDYCTGQYWPTEYRRAVCAVLSSAIWRYWSTECMPEGEVIDGETRYRGLCVGDYLRRLGRNEFGRGIASRWFH